MTVYVGADISKDTIDISYHSGNQLIVSKIPNEPKQIKKFVKKMQVEKGAVLHFILESTGYYSQTLYTTLRDMGIRFTQVNPRFSYAFAQSLGILDKTDKADARMLEEYGKRMTPAVTEPDEDYQMELKHLYMLRNALVLERRKWKQRMNHQSKGISHQIADRMLNSIKKEIERLDKAVVVKIRSHEKLLPVYEAMIKIEGIGSCTACAILCLLPEIGRLNKNQVSKLAGLAPMLQMSGTSVHRKAHIKGGRKHLRTALYMPCMVACRINPTIRAYYQRIRNNKGGEKVKGAGSIALIASMRKLLIHINSEVRKVQEGMQRHVAAAGCGEAATASPHK